MERRDFIKTATAAGVAAAAMPASSETPKSAAGAVKRPQSPDMVYRQLGTTGETVSAIGMGGFHIGKQADPEESIQLIHAGVDAGITFLDNCWDYNDGISEVRMGRALRQDGYRQKVFLMTKLDGRTATEYNKQLEQSMGRLQTDMIDLVQFHEILRMEDPDRIFGKGGAMEAAIKAREAGKLRYIGFTGHKDPAVHLRMLQVAEKNKFHFDTVQMPINVMDAHFRSFTNEVVPVAVKQGIGVLAMKTFGDRAILDHILQTKSMQPTDALRYGLSLPISVLITGIDTQPVLQQALSVAKNFKPMEQAEIKELLAKTQLAASEGRYELFKTSSHFDGTAQNPKWLGEELKGTAS